MSVFSGKIITRRRIDTERTERIRKTTIMASIQFSRKSEFSKFRIPQIIV
jgi:hypothetical protein